MARLGLRDAITRALSPRGAARLCGVSNVGTEVVARWGCGVHGVTRHTARGRSWRDSARHATRGGANANSCVDDGSAKRDCHPGCLGLARASQASGLPRSKHAQTSHRHYTPLSRPRNPRTEPEARRE